MSSHICGEPTPQGPCQHTVSKPGACWQHRVARLSHSHSAAGAASAPAAPPAAAKPSAKLHAWLDDDKRGPRVVSDGEHEVRTGDTVLASGTARVVVFGGDVYATENATIHADGDDYMVTARDNVRVFAGGRGTVFAEDTAHVIARGDASVVGRGHCTIDAADAANIVAAGECSVDQTGDAYTIAQGRARVRATSGNVSAGDDAQVHASGDARVTAFGDAHVAATKSAAVDLSEHAELVISR
ncbi:MAG TPA: hypothetical protein VHD87_15430 [Acidimicrobiales bacterium]|nr:hypothetical protein [Acidimicrobiales bacterium]